MKTNVGKEKGMKRKKNEQYNFPEAVGEREVITNASISRARALHLFLALIKPLRLDFFRSVITFKYPK
ncbi:hypothetical protein [Thermotomaculum hydrothermale]|uniref:hypothetical protein n=1 Tax=Thermotomaculum hydrothermale TaxID=981385 RepID=UPI001915E47E|nr:hypothetical protein [Thermotomaculum hydrothermale]